MQASQRSKGGTRQPSILLEGMLHVANQIIHSQVAHRNSKIISRNIFQFMRFVENHRSRSGEDSRIRRAIRLEFDGQIGKEQMMVDDNDVTFHPSPPHLCDEAPFPLAALLSN